MAEKIPKDIFDDVPNLRRVGAHRAPERRGRGWITFAWAAAVTAVLVVGGIFVLMRASGSAYFDDKISLGVSASPTPTPVETVSPTLVVNVLNATTVDGLGESVSKKLTAAGWKVSAVTNADKNNVTQTVVYYSQAANEGAALALAHSLRGATTQLTQDFAATGADLTVVVGSNQAK